MSRLLIAALARLLIGLLGVALIQFALSDWPVTKRLALAFGVIAIAVWVTLVSRELK